MDISVALDDNGTITVAAVNVHPVERTDAGVLLAEIVTRLHRTLTHCDGDDA